MSGESQRNEENIPHFFRSMLTAMIYFVPEINLFVFVFKSILQIYDINSKSLLFIFYIGITFAIINMHNCADIGLCYY